MGHIDEVIERAALGEARDRVLEKPPVWRRYAAVLGATVREREEGITTMVLPGATRDVGCWLSLTSVTSRIGGAESGTPPKAGTIQMPFLVFE